ncbi:spermatogenesis-associated protein 21 [Octodon degus]|uniref:Spermatogenesis-associated protein 21 n=1 Tax=Octodon degus TaxID=10160 RepID=A0A6P6F0Z9_OCTDE|nr:spermatogenesis-associated protein 21 [Octodon degus]
MANRTTRMDLEDRTEAPGVQPTPALTPTSARADAESTASALGQADSLDATEMDTGKKLLSTLGEPERGPQHTETSKEGCSELKTQDQWPRERPRPRAIPEELQQPGTEPEGQRARLRKLGTQEEQPLESRQDPECQLPGQQAENVLDIGQLREPHCTLDSCVQPLGDDATGEAGDPHISPREALPKPAAGGHEDSSQEAMCPLRMVMAEEHTATSLLLLSTLGLKGPQQRVLPSPGVSALCQSETAETQPVPRPLPATEARDMNERRELGHPQESKSPGNPRRGFMKCLLEAEEEEAVHRRAWKARALTACKSPRTLMPCPTSVRTSYSAPMTLSQTPISASATTPLWTWPPAPTPVAALPGPVPSPVLWGPGPDLGWRRTELLPQSHEWSPSYTRPWQEPEEHRLLKLCQGWEEQAEEHLTLKQEEGDGHVDFRDFLAVMTDTRRFFCSVEQNVVTNMAVPNPHTLLFEILSVLVEMLALPETVLEELTSYYQKKLKEGTCTAREMAPASGQLRPRKQVSYNHQQADRLEAPEHRVLSLLSRLKQNAPNLQSPYAQAPCTPLCPRLNKKMARRKQGSHNMLDQCAPASQNPSTRSLFFQSGHQGSREHSSDGGKWLSALPTRTH